MGVLHYLFYSQAPEMCDDIAGVANGELVDDHHLHISVASIQGEDTGALRNV